jgi:hypothetical protein
MSAFKVIQYGFSLCLHSPAQKTALPVRLGRYPYGPYSLIRSIAAWTPAEIVGVGEAADILDCEGRGKVARCERVWEELGNAGRWCFDGEKG